jgi:pimeloyl-[acyl-carrier protein] methyl ester esterase
MRDKVTCVFVHGWAMNSAVWDDCIAQLPDWIDVIVVDLPGHGTMVEVQADTLDDYVHSLSTLTQRPAIWIGWSLGGLAVLRLAELYPQRVASALLVATSPCFVAREGWRCAVDESVFDQFAQNLKRNQEKTIQRFLALQVKGLPDAIGVVRKLQQSLKLRGSASADALASGLKILLETDLRQNIRLIERPLHWLLGNLDGLVPSELAQVLQQEFAQENVILYNKASHAAFISHRDEFMQQLLKVAESHRVVS